MHFVIKDNDIYKIIHVSAGKYHIRELLQQRCASQPANIYFGHSYNHN